MIEKIEIENFKSIKKLSVDLGRVNVIIGANGTGKTNLLEAIAMGGAASANKLEYEFLSNRIRLTSTEFMLNAFDKSENMNFTVNFDFVDGKRYYYDIKHSVDNNSWIKVSLKSNLDWMNEQLDLLRDKGEEKLKEFLSNNFGNFFQNEILSTFLIYTPEYSFLNKFEEQGQILPLGLKGEGLFNALKKILTDKTNQEQFNIIKENLKLLDWFEDFKIPNDNMFNEHKISIQDKFLESNNFFDQKSSNEGFLFLLFYLVLFTSENTPQFFAIDNIDTGFNPKLCRELIVTLTELAKKYDKQVIVTTHNPAILDGLDLKDDEQRLLVVKRNRDGSTAIKRIEHKPDTKMKLSELWMSGAIGGLPTNF